MNGRGFVGRIAGNPLNGVGLLSLVAVLLFLAHYALFHDAFQLAFWSFLNLAFLPVEALVVTLILGRLLSERERKVKLEKLNMVIGAFFSETGNELLRAFRAIPCDGSKPEARWMPRPAPSWSDTDFRSALSRARETESGFAAGPDEFAGLKSLLVARKSFLLGLLGNQNLLEHDSFTDCLWAVFHLAEELSYREDCAGIAGPDRDHLNNDIARAWRPLVVEWLSYTRHLARRYPYLHSLAMRTHPFEEIDARIR